MSIWMLTINWGRSGEHYDLYTQVEEEEGYYTSQEAAFEAARRNNQTTFERVLAAQKLRHENEMKAYMTAREGWLERHKEWEILTKAGLDKPEPRPPTMPVNPEYTPISYEAWLKTLGRDSHETWWDVVEVREGQ